MAEQRAARGYQVEVGPVRPGEDLDWPRLDAYLRANIAGLDGPFSVLQFPNGSANLTYLVRIGDTELVVRRPPFGRLAPGAHDMRREFRAVQALSGHFDRAAHAYLFCDDHDVIGSEVGRTTGWSGSKTTSARFSAMVLPVTVMQSPCR